MRSPGSSRPTRWITSAPCTRKARLGLDDHGLDRALGHAGIVLQRQRGDVVLARVPAHAADEARDGADIGALALQRGELGADVEVGLLDAHPARPRSSSGHRREERDLGAVAQRRPTRRPAPGRRPRAPRARARAPARGRPTASAATRAGPRRSARLRAASRACRPGPAPRAARRST
jgi:hypothetical protein